MHPGHYNSFYRVSVKALIFDDQNRLLVFEDKKGEFEIPGGGLKHDETIEECVHRELDEEMRISPASIGEVSFVYTGLNKKGYYKLCLAVPVIIAAGEYVPSGDDLAGYRYVTKPEFRTLPFQFNEKAVLAYADKIWPSATKS
jgi:ADP-ribose pyrophosphatase YjhB (NUDIX family)